MIGENSIVVYMVTIFVYINRCGILVNMNENVEKKIRKTTLNENRTKTSTLNELAKPTKKDQEK